MGIACRGDLLAHRVDSLAVGRRDQHLPICVDDDRLTVVQRQHVIAETDHHRKSQPASNDRRVTGHASHRERDPANIAVELDDIGRTEIRSNQDCVAGCCPSSVIAVAGREPRGAASKAPDIGRPRGELRVTDHVQLRRSGLDLDENGAGRAESTREHCLLDRLEEHRVLGHHGAGVEDVGFVGPPFGSKLHGEFLELPRRLGQSVEGTRRSVRPIALVENGPVNLAGSVQKPHPSERDPR